MVIFPNLTVPRQPGVCTITTSPSPSPTPTCRCICTFTYMYSHSHTLGRRSSMRPWPWAAPYCPHCPGPAPPPVRPPARALRGGVCDLGSRLSCPRCTWRPRCACIDSITGASTSGWPSSRCEARQRRGPAGGTARARAEWGPEGDVPSGPLFCLQGPEPVRPRWEWAWTAVHDTHPLRAGAPWTRVSTFAPGSSRSWSHPPHFLSSQLPSFSLLPTGVHLVTNTSS